MSHIISDENIDPALRALDPTNNLLARIRSGSSSTPGTPPAGNENGIEGTEQDSSRQGDEPSPDRTPSSSSSSSSLVSYGRLVKRKMNFSETTSTRSPDERQALLFAHVLQLLESSKKNEKAELWTISPDLSKKISNYVQAFVFSPTTTSYRGLNIGEHIMKAMRECNVKSLPDEDDITAVDLVLTKIREKGTNYRNVYKTKVKESMGDKSEMRNVAILAHKLLKNSKIKPTLQFYQRLALIRWCIKNYPGIDDEEFWPKVDETIAKFRKQCETQLELDQCFNAIYEDDIKEYGDPAKTEYTTSDDSSIPSWQQTLRQHTQNIRPAQHQGGGPSKRRRIDDDGSDNE
ncbi:hypothetical protein B0H10DRAFT_2242564 [Mycena sp. CBHHK59/15]|nr:hypothetical protein B0H10DRAFT_2242564 [Mycena sp. CBHHK59/15]